MAKKRSSVRKREREVAKRQREIKKSQKAAEKRERRLSRDQVASAEPSPGTDVAPGQDGPGTNGGTIPIETQSTDAPSSPAP